MQKLKTKQVLIVIFIACTTNIHAQNIILHLPTDRRLSVSKPVPYNSALLLDNRYNKTPLKIINNGNFPVQYISFDSFAIEIKNYIENLSKDKQHKQDTLYIDLRDFRFLNTRPNVFHFYAKAYLKSGNHLFKIAEIKKYFSYRPHGYEFNLVKRKVARYLNIFSKLIYKNFYSKSPDFTASALSVKNLNTLKDLDLQNETTIHQRENINGIYSSFDNFKNGIIDTASFKLIKGEDSVFKIKFRSDNKFFTAKNNTKKYQFRFTGKISWEDENGYYKNIWGVNYDGKFYIQLMNGHFIELHKDSIFYTFHIPMSLPNMYAHLSFEQGFAEMHKTDDNLMMYSDNWIIYIIGRVMNIGANAQTQRDANNWLGQLKEREKKNMYRNGLLDFETGDIIYNLMQ